MELWNCNSVFDSVEFAVLFLSKVPFYTEYIGNSYTVLYCNVSIWLWSMIQGLRH